MTKEVMKQALEAFEEIASWYDYDQSVGALASSMYEASCLSKMKAEELRQAIAQAEKQEQNEPKCKTHPDAPHGFVRNASHSEDRYVCECEFWEPPEQDEPVAWFRKENGENIYYATKAWDDCLPLYTKPQTKEWVGLTNEEIEDCFDESCHLKVVDPKGGIKGSVNIFEVGRAIVQLCKERNT